MNVLGIDTSTAAATVCLLREDGVGFESALDPERLTQPPAHASELMPAIDEALRGSEVGWEGLDAVAVGVGPGSFTGLRIGIATARGIARARSLELRPVSSLAALAAGIDAPLKLPLIDARRGELAGALYEGGTARSDELVGPPEQLLERLGRPPPGLLAAGDGSLRFGETLEASGVEVAPAGSVAHLVRGLNVCRLAREVDAVAPEAVIPTYLRQPDTSQSRRA